MPIIKFQCMSCGLSFSKRVSIETTTQSCTNCKAICSSATQGGVSIGYNNVQVDSVKPQSTGLESLDTNFERVMAQDSKQKWEHIYNRRKTKWDLINETKGSGYDIVVTDTGDYVMDKPYHEVQKNLKNDLRQKMGINFQQEK